MSQRTKLDKLKDEMAGAVHRVGYYHRHPLHVRARLGTASGLE